MFDVLTTATLRPAILEITLASFYQNMFENSFFDASEFRHVMNVDIAGGEYHSPSEVFAISRRFFLNVLHRDSQQASFPKAFIWCWSNVASKYFLWLEDDWELINEVSISEMIYTMNEHPRLALLRLPRWESNTKCRQWNRYFSDYNGMFFKVPDDLRGTIGFSGNPSIIRTEFANEILPLLSDSMCPERQIKGRVGPIREVLERWDFGIFQRPFENEVVKDIGQAWRKEHKLAKDDRHFFQSWVQERS